MGTPALPQSRRSRATPAGQQRPIHDGKYCRTLDTGERGGFRRVARELTET